MLDGQEVSMMQEFLDKVIESTGFHTILGQQIPPCIIGDTAYPMLLLKPFSHSTSLNSQFFFLIIDYLEHICDPL